MKLIIVVSSVEDLNTWRNKASIILQQSATLPFLYSAQVLQHQIDFVETGIGVFQTTYKVTRALALEKYHLALKLSFGNAYKESHSIGAVLNIINEKPGDYGMLVNGEWQDFYDLKLLDPKQEPHVRGGFINLTNAYMNIFMPFKKAVGITVNHYADKNSITLRLAKYQADCETGDGLGFAYPCLFTKQNFYHLCVVERNLQSGEANFEMAKEKMNLILGDLLEKL